MTDTAAASPSRPTSPRVAPMLAHRRPLVIMVAAALLFGAAAAGSAWGRHQVGPRQLTGRAYATPYQIGVTVDGWTYDIPLSVPWFDSNGVLNRDGRPSCLPASTQLQPVTFAAVPVTHDGTTWRQVVWVSCRH